MISNHWSLTNIFDHDLTLPAIIGQPHARPSCLIIQTIFSGHRPTLFSNPDSISGHRPTLFEYISIYIYSGIMLNTPVIIFYIWIEYLDFILLYDLYIKMGGSERINITSINHTSNIAGGSYLLHPRGVVFCRYLFYSMKYGRAWARPLTNTCHIHIPHIL